MPSPFKEIILPGLHGHFDAQSTSDSIGWGNFRLVKNASIRGPRKRCRRGGWTRFYAEQTPYNNADLHDQLIDLQVYYDSFHGFMTHPGFICDYEYPYFAPSTVIRSAYDAVTTDNVPHCGLYGDWGYPSGFTSGGCFSERFFAAYPDTLRGPFYGACNWGPPPYWMGNYFYVDCAQHFNEVTAGGYGYGRPTPLYCGAINYMGDYCGTQGHFRQGCREAITLLHSVNSSNGRRLMASTMSRAYEYNNGTGDHILLGDGFGNGAFTQSQCTCNDVRFVAASMGDYTIETNGFNEPMIRQVGGLHEGCNVQAIFPIADLELLNVGAAGGVVSWKGFMFLFDVTLNNHRETGTIIWSDFENPLSWIPSDTSQAGQSNVAPGETFLAAAELGNFLYLYSDRSIWRVTLVGGDLGLFSFDQIYTGTSALRYKHTLVNTGSEHLYLGSDRIYVFTQFDQRPMVVPWIDKASAAIYGGMGEEDAMFAPINQFKCLQAVGGWNEDFKEVWFSWPTGNNTCPDMSLVLNVQYQAADLVDEGFTAFTSFKPDGQRTVAQWFNDQQICTFLELLDHMTKEGHPCDTSGSFSSRPQYIWNATENAALPAGPNGLCARIQGKTENDFCTECPGPTKFLMASARDFTIKEYRDDVYYREEYSIAYTSPYCAVACDSAIYLCQPYDTVLQTGADDYRIDSEKVIRRFVFEVDPVPQTIPSDLQCSVGWSAQAKCDYWKKLEPQKMKCLEPRTDRQLEDGILRADNRLNFETFYRGKYLFWRIKISGTGGGTCFGQAVAVVRSAENNYSR